MSAGGKCLRAARAPAVDLLAGRPSLALLPTSTRNKCQAPNDFPQLSINCKHRTTRQRTRYKVQRILVQRTLVFFTSFLYIILHLSDKFWSLHETFGVCALIL